jgi:hypothetical protein
MDDKGIPRQNQPEFARHEDEEGLFDERVGGIRHIRLWSGLVLIGVAILVIVLEQVFGPSSRTANPSGIATVQRLASISTAISVEGVTVEPHYLGQQNSIRGQPAGTDKQFIVIGLRITNGLPHPISINPRDFRAMTNGTAVATAMPYPGLPDMLRQGALSSRQTAVGIVVFAVPTGVVNPVLEFIPEFKPGSVVSWKLT